MAHHQIVRVQDHNDLFRTIVEPVAFWEGDLFALTFPRLGEPVVDVEEGMLTEDCTSSHLPPNFVSLPNIEWMNPLVLSLMSW